MVQVDKANRKIREAMNESGLPYWVLADLLKVHRCTLSEWMRHEMPEDKQTVILKLIEEEAKRRNSAEA